MSTVISSKPDAMRTCSVTFAAHPVPKKSFRLSKPLRAIIGEQKMIMKNTLNASVAVGEENYPEWAESIHCCTVDKIDCQESDKGGIFPEVFRLRFFSINMSDIEGDVRSGAC